MGTSSRTQTSTSHESMQNRLASIAGALALIGLYALLMRGLPNDGRIDTGDSYYHPSVESLEAEIRFAHVLAPRVNAEQAALFERCRDADVGGEPVIIDKARARAIVAQARSRLRSQLRYEHPDATREVLAFYEVERANELPCSYEFEDLVSMARRSERYLSEHRSSRLLRGTLVMAALAGAFTLLLRLYRNPLRAPVVDADPMLDPVLERAKLTRMARGHMAASVLSLLFAIMGYSSFCDQFAHESMRTRFWQSVFPVLAMAASLFAYFALHASRIASSFTNSDPELSAGPACELLKLNKATVAARIQAELDESRRLLAALEANSASPSEIDNVRVRVATAEAATQIPASDLPLQVDSLVKEIALRRSQLSTLISNKASPEVIEAAASSIQELRTQLGALVRLGK